MDFLIFITFYFFWTKALGMNNDFLVYTSLAFPTFVGIFHLNYAATDLVHYTRLLLPFHNSLLTVRSNRKFSDTIIDNYA